MGADNDREWQDWLVDESATQEGTLTDREELDDRKALLAEAWKTLNEHERHIMTERRLKDRLTTLDELAKQYNVSLERVRQIERRVLEKLRISMIAQMKETNEKRRQQHERVEHLPRSPASTFGTLTSVQW